MESSPKDEHVARRKKLTSWVRNTLKRIRWESFFSDENFFDLDGIYNSENDRMWPVDRESAHRRDGTEKAKKVFSKHYGIVSYVLRGRSTLVISKKVISVITVISEKCCLLHFHMETANFETTGPSNEAMKQHILIKIRKVVIRTFLQFSTRVHGPRRVPIRILWNTLSGTNSVRPSMGEK